MEATPPYGTSGRHSVHIDEQRDKQRLWQDLLAMQFGTTKLAETVVLSTPNLEANVFFGLMELAFTSCYGMESIVEIDRELIHHINGWALAAATKSKLPEGGSGSVSDEDRLGKAFNGFVQTIRHAVRNDQLRVINGRRYIGCLALPQWIIDKYTNEAARDERVKRST
jgi:hypothetical protein